MNELRPSVLLAGGITLLLTAFTCSSLKNNPIPKISVQSGLENLLLNHLDKISGKNVGIITNHTGVDRSGRPIWQLLQSVKDVKVIAVFSPEHGLFGEAAASEKVEYGEKLKLPPLYSLYGATRKPTQEMLYGIDILIYDIQDVGARFYTYITTMGLAMEAAAEAGIPIIILDRPNPLTGNLVSGPVLNIEFKTFVGYYPIPSLYGLTPGELALIIADRQWISHVPTIDVIPMLGWNRDMWYDSTGIPWIPTSPNIPDLETAIVYPATVLMEATNISEGRGTARPFRQIGAPWLDGKKLTDAMNLRNLPGVKFGPISFTPLAIPGVAPNPKHLGTDCHGVELTVTDRSLFRPVETGIWLLREISVLGGEKLEIILSGMIQLFGSDRLTTAVKKEDSVHQLLKTIDREAITFQESLREYRLYN